MEDNQAPFPDLGAPPPNGSSSIDIPGPKKRGRPKGSGSKKASSESPLPSHSNSSAPRVDSVDVNYFVTTAIMLFELADDYMRSRMLARLARYLPERKAEFAEMLEKGALNDRDRDVLKHTLTALAKKYDILSKFGPEVGLLLFGVQYGYRMLSLNAHVNSNVQLVIKQRTQSESTPQS